MTSHLDRVTINTRQRLKSDDFDRESRLRARALLEGMSAQLLGDVYKALAVGMGGVVGGLMVRAITGSNRIEVSPGIALIQAAPDNVTYDPPLQWIDLGEATEIDLTSLVDGANPRLVTIEISPTEVNKLLETRDVFDTGSGVFTSTPNLPVVVGSDPTLTATAGAAAAAPVVAAGTVGRLPLAVVKLVAAQASFADDYASVLLCRPMLAALGDRIVPRYYIRGGGISVGEESGGSLGGTSLCSIGATSLSMAGLEADVGGRINFASYARTPNTTTPGTLNTTVQPVYGYAVPPPWAADYGNIAPREAWQRNPNEVDTSNAQSIVFGSGNSFKSLIAETVLTPGRALKNAIVIWDSNAPWGTDIGLGNNAPRRVIDARGPHPAVAPGGAGSITLDATQDTTWGATQVVSEAAYIGAVSSIGGGAFSAQALIGRGVIAMIDALDTSAATGNRPIYKETSTVGLTSIFPGQYPAMGIGGATPSILPQSATWVRMGVLMATGTGTGTVSVAVNSDLGFGAPAASQVGGYRIQVSATVNPSAVFEDYFDLGLDNTGMCKYRVASDTDFAAVFFLAGYTDQILAAR